MLTDLSGEFVEVEHWYDCCMELSVPNGERSIILDPITTKLYVRVEDIPDPDLEEYFAPVGGCAI